MTLARLTELAPLYGAEPFELLFPPGEREQARHLAEAWEILRNLPAEQRAAWLLTGRSMAGHRLGDAPPAPPAGQAEPG